MQPAVLARGQQGGLLEGAGEVGLAGEAAGLGDLRQRYKKRGKQLPANILAANNMYVACEVSDDFNAVLPVAGEDNLVIGTDYGHNDNSSQIEALRMVRDAPGMNAKAIDKILWDNPTKAFGLGA